MKKLIFLCVALLLSLCMIVACGGDDTTTPKDTSADTTPADTTPADTTPAESTPAESTPAESTPAESTPAESTPAESTPAESTPADTSEPVEPADPVDILSKLEKMGDHYFAFEDHVVPGAGANKSKTITINIPDKTLNSELLEVVKQETGNDTAVAKEGYTWKLKINDTTYTIENIGTYYFIDSGGSFIRLEVGTLGFEIVSGRTYSIRLSIEKNGSELYYADLGSITVPGLDPDKDVGDAMSLTGISGPAGNPSPTEGYENLFDNSTDTKLCTVNDAPILFKADSAVKITSYSLVAGNDHGGGRRIIEWTLYGSNSADGEWVELDKQTGDPLLGIINGVEYNFEIDAAKQGSYEYYKLEYTRQSDTELMELSEIKLYVKD